MWSSDPAGFNLLPATVPEQAFLAFSNGERLVPFGRGSSTRLPRTGYLAGEAHSTKAGRKETGRFRGRIWYSCRWHSDGRRQIASLGDGSANAAPHDVSLLADHDLGSKRALHPALVRVTAVPAERFRIMKGMAEEDSISALKELIKQRKSDLVFGMTQFVTHEKIHCNGSSSKCGEK